MKKYILILALCISLMPHYLYAQKPDRSKLPELPSTPELKLPAIKTFELSNGLKVYFLEKHEVPLMQVNVVVKAGNVNDPENKTGVTSLTMDMLDEGANGKTALELADEIDYLGANISSNTGLHYSSVDLHTPLSKFEQALPLLSGIVLKPDFPQKELDRKKKERLTSIMQWFDQPTAIASIAFNKFLFGEEHPYGKTSIGTEASIKAATIDDLKNFHGKYFKSNNAYIIAVGDIKQDQLKTALEKHFGNWQKGETVKENIKEASQVEKRVIYLIDKPGAPQSVIRLGRIGVPRITPDYFPIVIMNTILGGSFSSRLNQNLREQHGYTYGAGSSFSFRPIAGPFVAQSSVQTEVTDSALYEFFKELKGIREPIPEDELKRVKNYLALSYPGEFQTVASIAGQIAEIVAYNLGNNYFNEYIPKVLNTAGTEVNNAATKYIAPEQMMIVVVGDRSKIEEGLRKLNLGEIKNLSIKDLLGEIPKVDETM